MSFIDSQTNQIEFASSSIDFKANALYRSLYSQYSENATYAQTNGSLEEAGYAAGSCAEAARRIGLLEQSLSNYKLSISAFQHAQDNEGLAWAKWGLANLLRQKGEYNGSSQLIWEAFAAARHLKSRRLAAYCVAGNAENTRIRGNYQLSIRQHYFAHDLFWNLGDIRGMSWALQGVGQILKLSGKYSASIRCFSRAADFSQYIGDLRGHAFSLKGMGENLSLLGLKDGATNLIEAAIREFSTIGYKVGIGYAYISLARHQIRHDHLDVAQLIVNAAETVMQDANDRRGLAYLGCVKGDIARLGIQINDAYRFYVQSHHDFREMGIVLGDRLAQYGLKTLEKQPGREG